MGLLFPCFEFVSALTPCARFLSLFHHTLSMFPAYHMPGSCSCVLRNSVVAVLSFSPNEFSL